MKILWIYPEFPYPLQSGFLRGFHLLRLLGRKNAITFMTLSSEECVSAERIEALRPFTEEIQVFSQSPLQSSKWISLVQHVPVLGWRLRERWGSLKARKQMRSAVGHALEREKFDVVLCSGHAMMSVLEGTLTPIVGDCGDTNSARLWQQMKYANLLHRPLLLLQYLREQQREYAFAQKTAHRCFISARDRNNLLGPSDLSRIVPQGVDSAYWKRSAANPESDTIVFSGVMSYPPNVDAAVFLIDRIAPLVRTAIPNLQVLIVGRDPSPRIIQAARRYNGVRVTGMVDDVRPHLERGTVFVGALRFASGVQNKILEAMAMEIPVVTTPVVAAGLSVDGVVPPLIVAESADEIAIQVARLLRCPTERQRRALDGRRFVEAHCSWLRSAESLQELCAATAANPLAAAVLPPGMHT